MTNDDIRHDRLIDLVELAPTKNQELMEKWDLDSGSEVHQYLESHLSEFYFRDEEGYIQVTDRARESVTKVKTTSPQDSPNDKDLAQFDFEKHNLILHLVGLTQELGRIPTISEMIEYGKYSYSDYQDAFGSLFMAFVESGIVSEDTDTGAFYELISSTSNESFVEKGPDGESLNKAYAGLTAFQRDILLVVNGLDSPHGLAIKDELEDYYISTIHHGRLYPNLDELVDKTILEKFEIDQRTNGYKLTEFGRAILNDRIRWKAKKTNEPIPVEQENVLKDAEITASADRINEQSTVVSEAEIRETLLEVIDRVGPNPSRGDVDQYGSVSASAVCERYGTIENALQSLDIDDTGSGDTDLSRVEANSGNPLIEQIMNDLELTEE